VRELKNKVLVVTGAASGIGRAIALFAAQRGMRVVLADIDPEGLVEAVREVEAQGVEAHGVRVDVGDAASVEQLAQETYTRFGAAHLLINNAGVAVGGAAWTLPLANWERSLRINLFGVVYGIHAFLPRMIAAGEPGHVVNVASAAGLIAVPSFAAYNASKFAVVGLTEALYHDLTLRKTKIGVSLLCPAWVQTRIADRGAVNQATADAVDAAVDASVARAVASGISAEQVACDVFDAVEAERFYVITHADTRQAVAMRSEDIVQGRSPSIARLT
jgi:short-subunit dehydrogenase